MSEIQEIILVLLDLYLVEYAHSPDQKQSQTLVFISLKSQYLREKHLKYFGYNLSYSIIIYCGSKLTFNMTHGFFWYSHMFENWKFY